MASSKELDLLKADLEIKMAYEKQRLSQYGDSCSMGKCAQSRVHFIEKLNETIKTLEKM